MRLPSLQQRTIPQYGVIEGGLLDGWTFALEDLIVDGRQVVLHVWATRPSWPFRGPLVGLRKAQFHKLRNPGQVAQERDVETLVKAAIGAAKS